MDAAALILVTLVAYKVVLLGIGILAERWNRDSTDYFLGGRRLGPTVAAISASASSSSAWTLLGVSGAAYKDGLSALWLFPACVGGFLLNWFVLAKPLAKEGRRTGAITVTDVLAGVGRQRVRSVAMFASVVVLISLGGYVASQYQAAGKAFNETFDLSMESSILIGAGVVILYTLLGGFWAVSLTDTLQGMVMALTALVLPIVALVEVGGFGGLAEGLRGIDQAGFLSMLGPKPTSIAVGGILGLLGIGLGYPGQPHVVNRFMALKEGPGAMRAARQIAISWAVVVYSGMLLIGLCGRVLFPTLADGENILVRSANELFHPIVAGVMLAAVLSAIMSTADSQLLVAASAVTHDLQLGGSTEKTMLFRSRATVLALGLGAVVAALYMPKEIFSNVLLAWFLLSGTFGPLLLVTVVHQRRMDGRRRLAVMATGFTLAVVGFLLTQKDGVLPSELRWLVAGVVPFVVVYIEAWMLGTPER